MSDEMVPQWKEKGNDLLTDLLYAMSQALQYDFDKITLKKNVYSPKAHDELEFDQYLVRKYVVELMAGERPIWITDKKPPDDKDGG